jgi:hypothetical protein
MVGDCSMATSCGFDKGTTWFGSRPALLKESTETLTTQAYRCYILVRGQSLWHRTWRRSPFQAYQSTSNVSSGESHVLISWFPKVSIVFPFSRVHTLGWPTATSCLLYSSVCMHTTYPHRPATASWRSTARHGSCSHVGHSIACRRLSRNSSRLTWALAAGLKECH